MGGLICAIAALPLIISPFDRYAAPNPIGFLLVLLGLPLGGLVYRIRTRSLPINKDAKRNGLFGIGATMIIPLCTACLVGAGSGYKAMGIIGIGFLVAMSAAAAILCCGFRRSP